MDIDSGSHIDCTSWLVCETPVDIR